MIWNEISGHYVSLSDAVPRLSTLEILHIYCNVSISFHLLDEMYVVMLCRQCHWGFWMLCAVKGSFAFPVASRTAPSR